MQLIDQDMYSPPAICTSGRHTITRKPDGTRYVLVGVRISSIRTDPEDMKKAHALQDGLKAEQSSPGQFDLPQMGPGEPEESARRADRLGHDPDRYQSSIRFEG